jgi:hypothetical protein
MMKRDLMTFFEDWRRCAARKPVILRGARQVGKSHLIRSLGESFESFVEVDFELRPKLASLFENDLDPARLVRDISLATGERIVPGETLLFLDEIQACPRAITALRYFHERMPGLHVVAAGSLIDFALEEVGVPVGRVSFAHLHPLSFLEFLSAGGHTALRREIEDPQTPGGGFAEPVHDRLLRLLGEYLAVGGMPEAVATWWKSQDLAACAGIHRGLVQTYRQDFEKYARRGGQRHVASVFDAIPRLLGRKFVFQAVDPAARSRELGPALELLAKAKVAHVVHHSSASGPPLGAGINPRLFKVLFLDVALAQSLLGLDLGEWVLDSPGTLANRGPIVEAFVGQEIIAHGPPDGRIELCYWVREKRGSTAEIDYLTSVGDRVVPIEVKAGTAGHHKSLSLYLDAKPSVGVGALLTSRPPPRDDDMGDRIVRLPLYAVSRLFTDPAFRKGRG